MSKLPIHRAGVGALLLSLGVTASVWATVPYTPVSLPGVPGFGPGIVSPSFVPGKEYSHDFDHEITALGTAIDAQQIVAWNGIGGVTDGQDFTGTRPLYTLEDQIDATANHGDFAYPELFSEDAHLIFSVDDTYVAYSFGVPFMTSIPSAGPVAISNGNTIGGAGELSYELGLSGGANPPDMQAVWATQPVINAMPVPDDIDGVEVWGPEPALTADVDKYSLDVDFGSFGVIPADAVSVWNGSGTPYIEHSKIVGVVTGLLGPIPSSAMVDLDAINLDALMVHDIIGDPDEFDPNPAGPVGAHDEIIFSIRQIYDPGDPDGYYATGSEIFVLDGAGGFGYFAHGGHLWDHAYSLMAFDVWFMDPNNFGVIDINALEAVGEFVIPEPAGASLFALGLLAAGLRPRRR